ncbi:hypothetical protein GCM10010228_38190 [Streptomyces massasporeus]|nr:hypothetical protein GCM10010228_38190 [Streptomyces massasporeus]
MHAVVVIGRPVRTGGVGGAGGDMCDICCVGHVRHRFLLVSSGPTYTPGGYMVPNFAGYTALGTAPVLITVPDG